MTEAGSDSPEGEHRRVSGPRGLVIEEVQEQGNHSDSPVDRADRMRRMEEGWHR
jgi:hypothetical protein